jgi:hypothetical protein
MSMHQATIERLTNLANTVRKELQGYQIGKFTKEPELGVFDIKMFGLRIKCIHTPVDGDLNFRVLNITDESLFDKDELFLELAASGYLRWIREKYSSHGYYVLLTHEKRGEKLLKEAKRRAIETKKGDFRIKYLESLLRRPFIEVYQEDLTIFDWIIL